MSTNGAHEGQIPTCTIVLENYMHTVTTLVFKTPAVVQQFAVCCVDPPVQGVAARGIHAPHMQGAIRSNPRLQMRPIAKISDDCGHYLTRGQLSRHRMEGALGLSHDIVNRQPHGCDSPIASPAIYARSHRSANIKMLGLATASSYHVSQSS
jgi:hypothetical protein